MKAVAIKISTKSGR